VIALREWLVDVEHLQILSADLGLLEFEAYPSLFLIGPDDVVHEEHDRLVSLIVNVGTMNEDALTDSRHIGEYQSDLAEGAREYERGDDGGGICALPRHGALQAGSPANGYWPQAGHENTAPVQPPTPLYASGAA
jgi:hypothetical protein